MTTTAPVTHVNKASSLTCISCRLLFSSLDEQRIHYKSDLHRFNLKRKVAKLPPVTQAVFEDKVQALVISEGKGDSSTETDFLCTVCSKHYSSANTLAQHLKSKRHIENLQRGDGISPAESVKVEVKETKEVDQPIVKTEEELIEERIKTSKRLTETDCIFCPQKSADLESNIEHMSRTHGFFIPDREYLQDLPGLIKYLGEKVSLGFECLYCGESSKSFWSLEAVQKHMRDVNHCKVNDDDENCDDFFDFSAAWENIPGDSTELPSDGQVEVAENGWELTLPGGRTAGHRQLRHFYRQRLPPAEREALVYSKAEAANRLLLGDGSSRSPSTLSRRDVERQNNHHMRLGIKANALMNVRPQLLQN